MKADIQFSLWHPAGLRVSILLKPEEVDFLDGTNLQEAIDIELNNFAEAGYTIAQPADPSVAAQLEDGEKVETITGIVFGKGNDTKLKQVMPRLYLFQDHRPYKAFTLFHEHIATLPTAIQELCKPLVDNPGLGEMQPPEKDQARKAGVYHECNFDIVVEPERNRDGSIMYSKNGEYIIYRYVRSVDGPQEQPTPAVTETAGHRNGNGKSAKLTEVQRNTIHALGTTYSGDKWDDNREAMVKWYGKERKPSANINSLNDLTTKEAADFQKRLEDKTTQAIKDIAKGIGMSNAELDNLCVTAEEKPLNQLRGVALSHILKEMLKAQQEWQSKQQVEFAESVPF